MSEVLTLNTISGLPAYAWPQSRHRVPGKLSANVATKLASTGTENAKH